ncbi:hypothetical protein [Nocardioides aurantiacus]|nr:hypothetical protein [Nocardioides aurantiacus]
MDERTLDRQEIDSEIARRVVFPQDDQDLHEVKASLASRMQAEAIRLLNDLRYEEAAALFRYALSENPRDAVAMNNLGFCLIPTDPREARDLLRQASGAGERRSDIHVANLVVCEALISGRRAALALAESAWNELPAGPGTLSTMWSTEGADHVFLVRRVDAKAHLAGIAAQWADELNDADAAARWLERRVA